MSQLSAPSSGSSIIAVETLTGNTGGPVGPTGGNINVVGTGVVSVAGNPGTSTLTISTSGAVASSFPTDSGTAVPAAGALTIHGTHGINTSGAGSTVTIAINNAITLGDLSVLPANTDALKAQTGDITITAGNFNMFETNAAGTVGVIKEINSNSRFIHTYSSAGFSAGNIFIGGQSGNFSNTSTQNIAVGEATLFAVTSGSNNCAIGDGTLDDLTSGTQNVAVGSSSGNLLTTGGHNTLLGSGAGGSLSGADSFNIFIGEEGLIGPGVNHRIHIGRIGVADAQTSCFIGGIYSITPATTLQNVVINSAGQLGSATMPAFLTWSVITANQTAVINKGYFCNKGGTLALALPAASSVGDIIEVTNENTALGVQFTQAAGQQILIGNTNTTLGATGTLTSSAVGDTLKIVCYTANTIWRVTSMVGNWTPA